MDDGRAPFGSSKPPSLLGRLRSAALEGPGSARIPALLAELVSALAKPSAGLRAESPAHLAASAWDILRGLPSHAASPERIDCLLAISQHFHHQAQPERALGPVQQAVELARVLGDRSRLRKTLTFAGVMLAETGNQPSAIEHSAEALGLAQDLGDVFSKRVLLVNTGLALMYAGQFEDAIDCFEAALDGTDTDPAHAHLRIAALGNIALACLNLDDLRGGLKAARRACEEQLPATDTQATIFRCLAENYYVRLLLESGNVEKARERCLIAKQLATTSGSALAHVYAEIAEGLTEVRDQRRDLGLSRLQRVLERARNGLPAVVEDALRALVSAHEDAGQVDQALAYLKELLAVVRARREDAAILHHRHHMERVRRDLGDDVSQEKLLTRKEQLLEGKLASRRFKELSIESLERLAVTAELRDDQTGEHSYRVGCLAALLAREFGCDEEFVFNLDLAGRLHDIGKIGIPDHILLKPGRLTDVEFNIMKTHTTVGAELLARSNVAEMQAAEDIARYHHEKWDGTGYPCGLSGSAIPLVARITALADVFDALTHVRPYKEAWPVSRALDEIERLSGSHFDPELTPIFLRLVRRLQQEFGDLDEFLGQSARKSGFIQARKNIAATLKRADEERSLDVRR